MIQALVNPGQAFRVATPRMLFEGSWAQNSDISPSRNMDLHPDGETFVLVTDPTAELAASVSRGMPVRLVVNWFEELKRLAGK